MNLEFFVLIPFAVVGLELAFVGWRDSSLRVLLNRSRSSAADWLYWALQFSKVNEWFLAAVTVGAFAHLSGKGITLNLLSALPGWLKFVVAFIVVDFLAYWTHRAYHAVPFLWDFHKVHHSATELNVLMTFRFHPLENLAWHVQSIGVFLVIGAGPAWYAWFSVLYTVLGQIQHARVRWHFGPVGKWIISPTFHRLHHSTEAADYSRNLGARLTIWDRLFCTYSDKDIAFDAIGNGETLPAWREFTLPFEKIIHRGYSLLQRRTYSFRRS